MQLVKKRIAKHINSMELELGVLNLSNKQIGMKRHICSPETAIKSVFHWAMCKRSPSFSQNPFFQRLRD